MGKRCNNLLFSFHSSILASSRLLSCSSRFVLAAARRCSRFSSASELLAFLLEVGAVLTALVITVSELESSALSLSKVFSSSFESIVIGFVRGKKSTSPLSSTFLPDFSNTSLIQCPFSSVFPICETKYSSVRRSV